MSWIYGASGGTNFWEEQIKNEKRLKKNWQQEYGVEVSTKRAAELQSMADEEAAHAAKSEANAKATARPKLQKVPATWKTKCGPTGESPPPPARPSATWEGLERGPQISSHASHLHKSSSAAKPSEKFTRISFGDFTHHFLFFCAEFYVSSPHRVFHDALYRYDSYVEADDIENLFGIAHRLMWRERKRERVSAKKKEKKKWLQVWRSAKRFDQNTESSRQLE